MAAESNTHSMPSGLGEDAILVQPIINTTYRFYLVTGILLCISGAGAAAYLHQYRHGLGVTGLNRPVFWGVYITNFVFFIGVSHAGTLISAILRIVHAEWRRAITRSAEVITVMVLLFGVGNVLMDLGRPDRMLNIVWHANPRSPLVWDVCSITIYLMSSCLYLYLPLIPDIAILRDHVNKRKWFYRLLALGWRGSPRQWRILHIAMAIMAVLIIPVAVTVHTVVSFVFAMTTQPMWHTAIFGPYFVAGAIFSGIAALIVALAVIRWAYGLGRYIKPIHFNNLGTLLFVMCCLWFYFTFCEFLTTFYGHEPSHMKIFNLKLFGQFAPHFWAMFLTCFVIPFVLLCNRRTRTIAGTVVASISVNIGMYLERYTIVVPSLSTPRLPHGDVLYVPTIIEWLIFAGCFSSFILMYALFTKLFPIVSIWEIQEGRETAVAEVAERVRQTLPLSEEAGDDVRPKVRNGKTAANR